MKNTIKDYIYTLYKIDKSINDIKYIDDFENVEQLSNYINLSLSRVKHQKIMYNSIDNINLQDINSNYLIIKELDDEYTSEGVI